MAQRSSTMLLLLLTAAAAPTAAADVPPPPQRIVNATVYGSDPCPKASGPDEVVVCGREPEGERYRLPKRFRGKREEAAAVTGSWTNTARELDRLSQQQIPNSCSTIGSFGQTGCMAQFLAQARAERAEARRQAAEDDVP